MYTDTCQSASLTELGEEVKETETERDGRGTDLVIIKHTHHVETDVTHVKATKTDGSAAAGSQKSVCVGEQCGGPLACSSASTG